MSWTRVGWMTAFVLGFAVMSAPADYVYRGLLNSTPWRELTLSFLLWIVRYAAWMGPVLLAMTFADNLPLAGAWRVAALTLALVLGVQFQWPIVCAVAPQFENACDGFSSHLWRSWKEMQGGGTIYGIVVCMPIALAYFYRRRDLRAAQALHAAELSRADAQRRTLEAELQTMQARVEPAFLFETLGDIGELFDRNPGDGEKMLDALIRYLRAALPDMRAARSTLRQEAASARAYLAVLAIRAGGHLAFDVRVPDALLDAEVPPMVVLPLLAAAIRPLSAADAPASLRVDAIGDAGRLRIAVTGRGRRFADIGDTPIVREVRGRLEALYGDRASLTVDAEPGRLTAVIELPHETP